MIVYVMSYKCVRKFLFVFMYMYVYYVITYMPIRTIFYSKVHINYMCTCTFTCVAYSESKHSYESVIMIYILED